MKQPLTTSFAILSAASLLLLSAACGGSSPAGPGPNPNPLPTGTPTPVATPTPDPQAGLPNGPVTRAVLYIYAQYANGNPNSGGTLKDKQQDAQGRWIARPGDFIVFDTSPFNAAGEKCRASQPPVYRLADPNGALQARDSTNPFLYRVDVVNIGEIEVISTVDGIDSTPLRVISTVN
jgi:hypothetical protein